MKHVLLPLAFLSILFSGAIFGFFYAWVCSTMWGLDAAEPLIAIAAMQAMNASVRNAVFAPAFFGTPLILLVTAAAAMLAGLKRAAFAFSAAATVYLLAGLMLTMLVNVPMNESLAAIIVPAEPEAALRIWQDYSPRWQFWNVIRTIASGVTLLLAATGLALVVRRPSQAF